jgi:hypothetical protein
MLKRIIGIGITALCFSTEIYSQPPASPCSMSAHSIPQRSAHAQSASEFVDAVAGMSDHERDGVIRNELMAGNLPRFLRHLQPVSWHTHLPGGGAVHLTLCVLADYLSLGSDQDFLLVPLGLASALAVAARFGFTLPTPRMVDLIYHQSTVHMVPQPLPAGDQMRSTEYLRRHDALVKQQRATFDAGPEALTSGDKKDLVLSARLWRQPGRVAIYGWHKAIGAPIQPLSTVHGAQYADYSHGVRLVSDVVFVNDQPRSIFAVLADPQLAGLLSDEGPLPRAAELLDARPSATPKP